MPSCLFSHISIPADTKRRTNVVLMLAYRLRRWPNFKKTSIRLVLYAGIRFYHEHLTL